MILSSAADTKGYIIKEYFSNYFLYHSDVTFDMKSNSMKVHRMHAEPWNVTLVDTGEMTMTGGRLKRVRDYIGDETFCMTYGDGVSDVDINELIIHHRNQGQLATLTSVRQHGRFGVFNLPPGRFQRSGISRKNQRQTGTKRHGSTGVSLSSNQRFSITLKVTTPSLKKNPSRNLPPPAS